MDPATEHGAEWRVCGCGGFGVTVCRGEQEWAGEWVVVVSLLDPTWALLEVGTGTNYEEHSRTAEERQRRKEKRREKRKEFVKNL